MNEDKTKEGHLLKGKEESLHPLHILGTDK